MTEENGTPTDDAAAVAEAVGADEGAVQESTWNYAEGVQGQGDKPEWFKADKYANITEQAKAYTELEGRFGSFTGAPEKYEINLSEQIKEGGFEFDETAPIMEEAMKFAQESNMSQEGFDKMMELYAMAQMAESEAMESYKAEEIKSLGANAESRINNLNDWAARNLTQEMVDGFQEMATSANAVKTLEKLVAMTRSAPINDNDAPEPGGVTVDEIKKMMFEEKDARGNRRYATDREFRKKVDSMAEKVWGSGDNSIIVGG